MKAALKRLHDVIFTPAIRWYRLPRPDARIARYPSPASEPVKYEEKVVHYKTAFRDSQHQIRYSHFGDPDPNYQLYTHDPISFTAEDKLVHLGFLKKEQKNDKNAVIEARKNFEQDFGESVDVKASGDFWGEKDIPISKNNRESIAYLVRQGQDYINRSTASEGYLFDLEDIYNPSFYHFKTYDCAADDAVMRQLKLDIEYRIEAFSEAKADLGVMPVFKSDPSFWQALDNSFSPENIRMVQSAIHDKVSNLEITALAHNHLAENFHGKATNPLPIQSNLA